MFAINSGPRKARGASLNEPGADAHGRAGLWRLLIAVAIIAAIVTALDRASESTERVGPAAAPDPNLTSGSVTEEFWT